MVSIMSGRLRACGRHGRVQDNLRSVVSTGKDWGSMVLLPSSSATASRSESASTEKVEALVS